MVINTVRESPSKVKELSPPPEARPNKEVKTLSWPYYATLDRNFILADGGLVYMVSQGMTRMHLLVLLRILAHAQCSGLRRVVYQSRRQLLEDLGWPDTVQYYDALKGTLSFWSQTTFTIPKWYKGKETVKYVTEDDERGTEVRKLYKKQQMGVWSIRDYGNGFVVVFDRKFYGVNMPKSYFCQVYFQDMVQLRSLQQVLMMILLRAMRVVPEYKPVTLARKVGITDSNHRRVVPTIREILAAVQNHTTLAVEYQQDESGKFHIEVDYDDERLFYRHPL